MKHTYKVTAYLIILFIMTQLVGMVVLSHYIDFKKTSETGETVLNYEEYETTTIMPPEVQDENYSFIYVIIPVAIGTIILLLIIKFAKKWIWKAWFFLAVLIMMVMSLSPFLRKIFGVYSIYLTLFIGIVLAYYKIFKKNIYIHNLTEIFIYGGLASVLVPILNLTSMTILFVLFALYDAYAVWKSKHMVKMAEFMKADKLFAGLYVPYSTKDVKVINNNKQSSKTVKEESASKQTKKSSKSVVKEAILGGGDCAIPLLLVGVIMKSTGSFLLPLIIVVTTTLSLGLLFYLSKKDRYYPAIPFLLVGSYIGVGIVYLIA